MRTKSLLPSSGAAAARYGFNSRWNIVVFPVAGTLLGPEASTVEESGAGQAVTACVESTQKAEETFLALFDQRRPCTPLRISR